MAPPTDRPSFLGLRGSTEWVQATGERLARRVWDNPGIPLAATRLLADARAAISWRADQLLDGLQTRRASVVTGLTGQATRLAERMTAHLSVASRDDMNELRRLLTQVEQKLDRLARERQNRPPHAAADPDVAPPSLRPWPAE